MPKNKKKKAPGRPKKEFVSRKPKKIKDGPGRPRKDQKDRSIFQQQVPPEIKTFVTRSVDESKKKDLIILILFLLSFILFVVSLYFTFMKEKKPHDLTQEEKSQIMNIQTGNIDYNAPGAEVEPEVKVSIETPQGQNEIVTDIKPLNEIQQVIVDFYYALNRVDMDTIYKLTDARLEETNVFKTYFSKRRLTNFSEALLAPKVVVTNIQEVPTTSNNPDIKNFDYTLEYVLASNQQKFTEERSTTLVKKGDNRRIGKLMCQTKGCSLMPFFNPEKYKN